MADQPIQFESFDKQVLRNGKHYCDAVSVEAAREIVAAMNRAQIFFHGFNQHITAG